MNEMQIYDEAGSILTRNNDYKEFREWFIHTPYMGQGIEMALFDAWSRAKNKYSKINNTQ